MPTQGGGAGALHQHVQVKPQSLGPLVLWREHRPPGGAVAAEISKAVASSPILNQKSIGPAVSVCVVFRKYG